jgi:hypothetical protein
MILQEIYISADFERIKIWKVEIFVGIGGTGTKLNFIIRLSNFKQIIFLNHVRFFLISSSIAALRSFT